MNSINLFPTEDKQTLKAEKLRFQFSFSSYSSYMTISSCDKELTIYLYDQSVRDQIIFTSLYFYGLLKTSIFLRSL